MTRKLNKKSRRQSGPDSGREWEAEICACSASEYNTSSPQNQNDLLIPNLKFSEPQVLCYPDGDIWLYWFYPGGESPIPGMVEAVGVNGPVVINKGKLLMLVNSNNAAEALGFKSQKFLTQDKAIERVTALAFEELRDWGE